MKTILLSPAQITEHWDILKEPLKKAFETGQHECDLSDYLARALTRQAQIWVFQEEPSNNILGVGLTQFLQYTNYKTLHIVAVGGIEWDKWADCYYIVEQFAKDNGCKAVEQWGRRGWTKLLKEHIPGFETVYHVMRKELDED